MDDFKVRRRKMWEICDRQITACEDCDLYVNGRAKPYWTDDARFAIVGEAPGFNEVRGSEPFIGAAGKLLMKALEDHGFKREQFMIINAVNCRPVIQRDPPIINPPNGKPTEAQMGACSKWVTKYLKVTNPERIIILGAYALFTLTGKRGIIEYNGSVEKVLEIPSVISVHPAYSLYSPSGKRLLYESISKFKELQ
jgi:DNA polymerase